jgi:DNA-binding NarL/FixJ family response regulator
MTDPRRVFLVEDHPVMREGYAALFARSPGLSVCGEAADATEALVRIREVEPDLALIDLALPGTSGLELIRQLRAFQPDLRVLVVSAHSETLYAERALRAGAQGYVMKDEAPATIVDAARAVLDGERYLSPAMRSRGVAFDESNEETDPVRQLSNRELEVFRHLGRGRSTREIADALYLSPKTVETYRANIKSKLGIRTAPELIQRATLWVESLGAEV